MTIDIDVAAQLDRLRRKNDTSLKDLINDALRRGLQQIDTPSKPSTASQTRSYKMGKPLIDIDNIAEAITYVEGDAYK